VTAASVLFPTPIHLVRRIDDPIAHSTVTLEQFGIGNRLISTRDDRVVIADYAAQTLTEIDRATGTYSVTRFADIAAARGSAAHSSSSATTRGREWRVAKTSAQLLRNGVALESYSLTVDDGARSMEVGIDRQTPLSREAVEVLLGAAYPAEAGAEQQQILSLAAAPATSRIRTAATGEAMTPQYGLPAHQEVTWRDGSGELVFRNDVIHVDHALPPAEKLLIPPGATLVESRAIRRDKALRELDAGPPARAPAH
jgi:hypothetical protein